MNRVVLGHLEADFLFIMLAAGMCKSVEDLALVAPPVNIANAGAFSLHDRRGHTGSKRTYLDPQGGFVANSIGLENRGVEYLLSNNQEMARAASGTPLVYSLVWFAEDELVPLLQKINTLDHDGIELDLSCPTIVDHIIGYQPEKVQRILQIIAENSESRIIIAKLPIYPDRGQLAEVATVINESTVDAVVASNSFPDCIVFDEAGRFAIETPERGHYSALSGDPLRYISAGQAAQFREKLKEDIAVFRCGGISTGADLVQSVQLGCAGVQVGSGFLHRDTQVFRDIREQAMQILTDS